MGFSFLYSKFLYLSTLDQILQMNRKDSNSTINHSCTLPMMLRTIRDLFKCLFLKLVKFASFEYLLYLANTVSNLILVAFIGLKLLWLILIRQPEHSHFILYEYCINLSIIWISSSFCCIIWHFSHLNYHFGLAFIKFYFTLF